MPEFVQLVAAGLCYLALALLALLQLPHRKAVWRVTALPLPLEQKLRRVAAGLMLTIALGLLLMVDGPGFALLLWLWLLALMAAAVAFTLSWKPSLLRWLP